MTLPAFLGNSGIKNFSHGLCIRTGHVFVWGTNPLRRLRRHLPLAGGSLSTQVEALAEPVGEPLQSQPVGCASFPEGDALGKEGRFRPYSSTAGRSLPLSCKLYAFAKASPFRERWHGEAVTERVASGTNPLSLAALDSSPEGGALGKEGRSCPHSLTAGRSLLLSCKLYASAKASTFGGGGTAKP